MVTIVNDTGLSTLNFAKQVDRKGSHYTDTHTMVIMSNSVVVILSQCIPYHIIRLYFFILATPHNMQDMSSPSREGNCAHDSGSVES